MSNETLRHVRFEFDLFGLAMKLNSEDSSGVHDRAVDVDEIGTTLENLLVKVATSVRVRSEVSDRTPDQS